MIKKLFRILVCMLLISAAFSIVSGTELNKQNTISALNVGNILYVGGSGPGNYSKIQDAINDSNDGDTVFVYDDSSPYYENVIVDKSINLNGEDRDTTIIDGNLANESVVVISADKVDFSGFTVQNCNGVGFLVTSSLNNIHNCRIRFHNWRGMRLQSGFSHDNPPVRQNTIAYNIFENNDWGLLVYDNIRSSIIGNIAINNTGAGISITGGFFCTIKNNIMVDNGCGLWLGGSIHRITKNEIKGNRHWGIFASHGNFNIITRNNFIDNGFEDGEDNYYTHASYHFCYWQYWSRNYWSPRRNLSSGSSIPYFIFRRMVDYTPLPFNIDWRPAKEPYDI